MMLLSWGIIFGWMGQDEIGDIFYFTKFLIRLMGPMSILLPQITWTDIYGKHSSPHTKMLLEKIKKKHNLGELIPAYAIKSIEITEPQRTELESEKNFADDKPSFYLEPEKRTTVIHTSDCKEFLDQTDNGENLGDWIGPFTRYEEAFEKGSNIEGKSARARLY